MYNWIYFEDELDKMNYCHFIIFFFFFKFWGMLNQLTLGTGPLTDFYQAYITQL